MAHNITSTGLLNSEVVHEMISYKPTKWTASTRMSVELLNNIEQGVYECAQELNKIGSWAKSASKPKYTAEEINAEPLGSLKAHEINGRAHEYLFGLKQDKLDQLNTSHEADVEELKKQISTMKAQITKLTTRIKALESGIVTEVEE